MDKNEKVLDLLAILFVIATLGLVVAGAIYLFGAIVIFYLASYIILSFTFVESFLRIYKLWYSREKKERIK